MRKRIGRVLALILAMSLIMINVCAAPATDEVENEKYQEALKLQQEVLDATGNLLGVVTADVEADTFEADTSEVSMEVDTVEEGLTNEIKGLIDNKLMQNQIVGKCFLYNVEFLVNGVRTEPNKDVKLTFKLDGYGLDSTKEMKTFYYNEANSPMGNAEAEIVETDWNNDGTENSIVMSGKRSTVYGGCLIEEQIEQVEQSDPEELENTVSGDVSGVEDMVCLEQRLENGTIIRVTAPNNAFDKNNVRNIKLSVKELGGQELAKITKQLENHAKTQKKKIITDGIVIYDVRLIVQKNNGKEMVVQPNRAIDVSFENTNITAGAGQTITAFEIGNGVVTEVQGASENNGKVTVKTQQLANVGYYVALPLAGGDDTVTEGEGTLADQIIIPDISNNWQIVKEGYKKSDSTKPHYKGEGEYPYFPEKNNIDVRMQKNIIPTGTENEFQVYLNVEPQLSWNEILRMTGLWLVNSASVSEDVLQQLDESKNAQWVKDNLSQGGSHVSKILGNKTELKEPDTTTHAGKVHEITVKYNIYDDGKLVDTSTVSPMYYALPKESTTTTILVRLPFQEHYSKVASKWEGNTLVVDIDEDDLFEGTGEFVLRDDKVNLKRASDPMGEYIQLLDGSIQTTNGSTSKVDVDGGKKNITWGFPENKDLPLDFSEYEIVTLENGSQTVYWKHAYEMMYKIRLDVMKNGFQSCASELGKDDADKTEEVYRYATNGITTLEYALVSETTDKLTSEKRATFEVPEVRGLLYNIEFQKIDSVTKQGLKGAGFTLIPVSGDANQPVTGDARYQATSGEDGYAKFHNLPWGTYKLEETKIPDDYKGSYQGEEITVCYTTGKEMLQKDHTIADGEPDGADKSGDEKNMLFLAGENGKIENTPEITIRWEIYKKSVSSEELFLEGAEFELKSTTVPAYTYIGISDVTGKLKWKDSSGMAVETVEIPHGRYELRETKAPAGYVKSDIVWMIDFYANKPPIITSQENSDLKFVLDDQEGIYKLYIINEPLYDLPETGGNGIYWYIVSGVLLLIAAGMLILYKNKRKEVLES